jgi:alkylation response protein AidB-like acyl-CoA dehydrogenase
MESSINKVFWSQWDITTHETALDLLGADAELAQRQPSGNWLGGYLFSLSGPIYAGTNEIQRNVIAERLLGLPRGDR